jgi:hypothetical protein
MPTTEPLSPAPGPVATHDTCPVCLFGIGDEPACAVCGWRLDGGYVLGRVTLAVERAFEEQVAAAQRRFDLEAAVRAAGFPDAGDLDLLARLEALVRAGPPPADERDHARRSAGVTNGPEPRSGRSAEELASEAAGTGGDRRMVKVAEIDAEGVAVSSFMVTEDGGVRELANLELTRWTSMLPELGGDPDELRFRLAGGVGRRPVVWAELDEAMDQALPGSLAAEQPEGTRVVLVCRVPGWAVPERLLTLLSRRLPDAQKLRERADRPAPATGRPVPSQSAAVRCPEGITSFAAVAVAGSGPADRFAVRMAVGSPDGSVSVWTSPSSEATRRRLHDGRVTAIDLSEDGTLVVSGGNDQAVRIWSAASGQARVLAWHGHYVNAVRLCRGVVLSLGDDGQVRRTALDGEPSGAGTSSFPLDVGWTASTALTATRDAKVLAVGGTDGTVGLRDGSTGQLLGTLEVRTAVLAMAFDPSGQLLAVGGNDGGVRLYRLAERRLVAQVGGGTGTVRSVAVVADGSVASGDDTGAVRHWRADGGRPAGDGDLVGMHEGRVRGLALTPEGLLHSAGADGYIRIWQV